MVGVAFIHKFRIIAHNGSPFTDCQIFRVLKTKTACMPECPHFLVVYFG